MKVYKFIALFYVLLLYSCFSSSKTVTYCDREYIEKVQKVYLTDEKIESKMVQVIDKESKKDAFGYHINAMRNDTNFIYSNVLVNRDTISLITYYKYNISQAYDSATSKFICTQNGIKLRKYQAYKDGLLVKEEDF
jgi:hypothetical protein